MHQQAEAADDIRNTPYLPEFLMPVCLGKSSAFLAIFGITIDAGILIGVAQLFHQDVQSHLCSFSNLFIHSTLCTRRFRMFFFFEWVPTVTTVGGIPSQDLQSQVHRVSGPPIVIAWNIHLPGQGAYKFAFYAALKL